MKKALFLVLHRNNRSPGQRYRHEQYINYLEENGIHCEFSPLLSEKGDKIFYGSGGFIQKVFIGLSALLKRLRDVRRANQFDIIYIYRDSFFFGTFIERMLARKKPKLIFDFDDAIWLSDINPKQGIFNLLKNPSKTAKITALCDTVIVGNEFLADYARQFNSNIHIIPSTIDFSQYQVEKMSNEKVCIGWTGSFSTIKHFESISSALKELKDRFQDRIYFKLIGDESYENNELEIKGIKWKAKTEAQDLSELDIGLMPLPDDEWSKGKCAMKGLQYMALEIPTIMSPVGVNKDIIEEGVNGFLATTKEEWVDKLSQLIESAGLRERLGKAGRKTVEKNYSVEANKDKWLAVFQS